MSENQSEMPFLGHLEELRKKILYSVIALFTVTTVVFVFKDFVFNNIVLAPHRLDFFSYRKWCELSQFLDFGDKLCISEIGYKLQSTTITGNFMAHIMVSIVLGIIVSFPFIFSQFWSFIKPGLKKEEIKTVRGITFFTSLLFFTGVAFGYFMIVPLSLQFLGNYNIGGVEVISTMLSYMKLITAISLATGVLFQLPIIVYFLSKIGLVTPELLKKYRKHALVGILILSAIITPPDIMSQVLVSIPVLFLYEVSIVVSRRVNKKRTATEVL